MRNSTFSVLRALFALTTLVAVAGVHAQNITVTAANSSNDAIYNVLFNGGGGSTTLLNNDQGSLHRLTSVAFFSNPRTFQLDLLAADNQGGVIVRYAGDFQPATPPNPTTGTVVFSAGGAGPANPDALSVDAAANLFVVNSKPGNTSLPQLWVLPADGAGGFGAAVSIDRNFPAGEALQETLVAGTTIKTSLLQSGAINPGDLLVLTSGPAQVLLYPGNGVSGPVTSTAPTVLLSLPVGTLPGGLAFWPPDNSLLISTSRGTILQYHLTANETPGTFASGLGNGQFKIKTGIQFGVPYAYVANNNGGDILQFGGSGQLPPLPTGQLLATVTTGVQHPQGLDVTNAAYAPLSNCQNQQTNGCDLLGGKVLTHNVPANLSLAGNVIENVCVVPVDPRLANAPPGSSCTTALAVSTVCAGFSSTTVIPASLCGSSGPSGKGFALVKTQSQSYATPGSFPFNGYVISNDANLPNILPPAPTNPNCNPPGTPLATLAWAPLAGEGIVDEGNNMLEVTSGCDGSTSRSYGLSLYGVGLGLNTTAIGSLQNFASGKYASVLHTIQGQITAGALADAVPPSSAPPNGNFTYSLRQCVSTSQGAFAKGAAYYGGAAKEVLTADQNIAAVATLAAPFNPVSGYPNPSGALRSRLENIYYTINTRIQGQTAASAPPSPAPLPPQPTISGTPALTIKAGNTYTFLPTAADFAGNTGTLSFSVSGRPSWATFDPTNGKLTGIATKGTYPGIVISVTDGCASASLPAFQIRVN